MILSKESSYLTTFASMFGRYRYVHVPMGASLSSDCFQYKMDQIFSPIAQCCGIANDLIIYGYSEKDHDRLLFQILDTAKCVGLRFNPDTCILKSMQIAFFDMLIGSDGIRQTQRRLKPSAVNFYHIMLGK